MPVTVPVRWVLDQADLRLRLRGGAGGVGREISRAASWC
jgi:PucR family transcriptional regulator, purine catabolism regulatory protein